MTKNTFKLNEAQLRKVVAESVRRVLKEGYNTRYDRIVSQFANLILSVNDENTAKSLATEIWYSFPDGGQGLNAINSLLERFEPNPEKAAQINNDFNN